MMYFSIKILTIKTEQCATAKASLSGALVLNHNIYIKV